MNVIVAADFFTIWARYPAVQPSQNSGHNQIGVDLHTQPGTLGH
jgi:hypothetical protein